MVVGVLASGDDRAGDGVDVVFIALAVGGEVQVVISGAVAVIQLGVGEGGCALGDAGVVQGDGLGRVHADVAGLGVLLSTACQGQGQGCGGAAGQDHVAMQFHKKASFSVLALSYQGNMKQT